MKDFLDGYYENAFLRLVRQNSTTLGLEVNGSSISNSFTLATMPDASAVEVGTIINIPSSEFVTSSAAAIPGMPEYGIFLAASNDVWVPAFRQVFCQEWGTKASPLATMSTTSATKIEIALPNGNPIVPLEIYAKVGFNLEIGYMWGMTGSATDATVMSARFGWSATYKDNCQVAWSQMAAAATNRQGWTVGRARITEYASAASNKVSVNRLQENNNTAVTSDTGYVDVSNSQDFTKDAYLSFSWEPTGAGADSGALYGYRLIIG